MYLEKFRLNGKTDPKAAATGCGGLLARGYNAEAATMDVTDSARVSEVADQLASRHGKIDILVNNAGIARSETPAEQVTDEHWLNVVDVNLNGTFWCCRAFGKHMLAARSGSIVNIGSMSGFIVNKPQEQCYYNASKAAVHHLTKSLAAEWGVRGVRVNAVAPTYVATPLNAFVKNNPQMYDAWIGGTPMARMGEVDEVWDPDGTNGGGRRSRIRCPVPGIGCGKPDDRERRSRRWGLYLLVGLRGP